MSASPVDEKQMATGQAGTETLGDGSSALEPAAAEPEKILTPAAQRALAEAAERRARQDEKSLLLGATEELRGRGGLDPVRYDDWDVKGIAVDF